MGIGRPGPASVYDGLDLTTLTSMLMAPGEKPNVHRGALSAIRKIDPDERRLRLVEVFVNFIEHAERYDQEVMMALIELFATDPAPKATAAMLEILPHILDDWVNSDQLENDFRKYFYDALMTRRRNEDKDAWVNFFSTCGVEVLAQMMIDPAADSIRKIVKPMSRIEKLSRSERNKANRMILMRGGVTGAVQLVRKK